MKYAFALAGGGTRGAFEVGVRQALKELGIEISAVCGTSIGAVNGAMFASGKDGEELWQSIEAKNVADIEGDNLFSLPSLFDALKKLADGGIDFSAFGNFLSSVIDEDAVRNSDIDYGLCTFRTDTKKSEELFISDIPKGRLVEYILASASFPLFKPVTIDGVEYSDGGWRNNLPVNMLINKGYNTIIAVSVKGPGIVKNVDKSGINIIEINCKSPEVGVMEFDRKAISDSIKSGYFECMRVFGKYPGKFFSFDTESYAAALRKFGPELIFGLEEAGRLCKIDPYRVYTFDEFESIVLSNYAANIKLKFLVAAIEKKIRGSSVFDSLGKLFLAANSIVYLKALNMR